LFELFQRSFDSGFAFAQDQFNKPALTRSTAFPLVYALWLEERSIQSCYFATAPFPLVTVAAPSSGSLSTLRNRFIAGESTRPDL